MNDDFEERLRTAARNAAQASPPPSPPPGLIERIMIERAEGRHVAITAGGRVRSVPRWPLAAALLAAAIAIAAVLSVPSALHRDTTGGADSVASTHDGFFVSTAFAGQTVAAGPAAPALRGVN